MRSRAAPPTKSIAGGTTVSGDVQTTSAQPEEYGGVRGDGNNEQQRQYVSSRVVDAGRRNGNAMRCRVL